MGNYNTSEVCYDEHKSRTLAMAKHEAAGLLHPSLQGPLTCGGIPCSSLQRSFKNSVITGKLGHAPGKKTKHYMLHSLHKEASNMFHPTHLQGDLKGFQLCRRPLGCTSRAVWALPHRLSSPESAHRSVLLQDWALTHLCQFPAHPPAKAHKLIDEMACPISFWPLIP